MNKDSFCLIERESPILISCEHASQAFPHSYPSPHLTRQNIYDLYDLGALEVATFLSQELKASLIYTLYSPLFINVNQKINSPFLIESALNIQDREERIRNFYLPYHNQLGRLTERLKKYKSSCFISVHTFSQECKKNHAHRKIDFGILFKYKKDFPFCQKIKQELEKRNFLVAFNQPYSMERETVGYTIKRYGKKKGMQCVEFEINNKFFKNKKSSLAVKKALLESLREAITV
jgi:predicted N-formylglutamate amidohydrolase